jgi:hypothetical protein
MIKYALKCADGHEFESWFPSSASFDQQIERGHVVCPVCATTHVGKAIMAPGLYHADRIEPRPSESDKRIAALRALRDYVMGVTEDVGARFADEARKIAEGFGEDRAIRGLATPDEAKALLDEGIAILPLPRAPEDLN